MSIAADPKSTAEYLWKVLRYYIEHACVLIGLPTAIAQRVWIARWEYRRLAEILRPLEALLRRLIFLEAAQLPPEQPRVETKSRITNMRARCGAAFDPDRSETWAVRFNLDASSLRQAQRGEAHHHACLSLSKTSSAAIGAISVAMSANAVAVVSAAPLALRLEALIRGFNDPAPLARRLARRLRRVPSLVRRFIAPPARRDAPRPCFHSVAEASALCAELLFCDSS
jgi:hypothetical protein